MGTAKRVNELFEYRDGHLYRKVKRNNSKMGVSSGTIRGTGSRTRLACCVDGKYYANHRLIFLMHHGYLPAFVDHIDGDRMNNRIENLRACTREQNCANARTYANNTTGVKGVCYVKSRDRWIASIQKDHKRVQLGYFKTKDEAADAVRKARCELHGDFARHE